jgi:hypothetical protein
MFLKKILAVSFIVAFFLAGFVLSSVLRYTLDFDFLRLFLGEKKEETSVAPLQSFLQLFTAYEFKQFDQLYDQRQKELRDIIAEGSEKGAFLIPKGLFAQSEGITSKIDSLSKIPVQLEKQGAIRDAMIGSYQLLKETYEQEIAFLKDLPTEGQNVKFVTGHIFEISAKAQRSGFQFLTAMFGYRKLLAEAIGSEETIEGNQMRIRDLVALNSLIDKYKSRLNVSLEAA